MSITTNTYNTIPNSGILEKTNESNIRYLINIIFLILGLFSFNSCTPESIIESICEDESSCNYLQNSPCTYPQEYTNCMGQCLNDINYNGICDEIEATNCTPIHYNGYTYQTVWIGWHCWFAENLKTPTDRDGNPFQSNLSQTQWTNSTSPSISIYGEIDMNLTPEEIQHNYNKYGYIYNMSASTTNLCPPGWQTPQNYHWERLVNSVGGDYTQLMSSPQDSTPWTGSNLSSFTATPGGDRNGFLNSTPQFNGEGTRVKFWSRSGSNYGYEFVLRNNDGGVGISLLASNGSMSYKTGRYIRCVKQ
jgi:uncharacterized protein (TIGR02145 family)